MTVEADGSPSPRRGPPRRILLGAFGDPGHAFPMLALGEALVARGHGVCLQTWRRWREATEAGGMDFAPAPEYQVFPTPDGPLKPYAAAVRAARDTLPLVRAWEPELVVHDVLTPAPALAAELAAVPVATLVPHVFPMSAPGFPTYAIGARLPRTRAGATLWRQADRAVARGLALGRSEYNECRRRLGLRPLPWVHTGMSRELTLVGTLPHLEYPRTWPAWTRVVGPLQWEPPGDAVAPAPGNGPMVLVAPSTAQDPRSELLGAAIRGLAGTDVRVIATTNGRRDVPAVATKSVVVVPWLSYAKTMPACDLVITHGGHGTLVRALSSGCPVVVCPAGGDMAENAARADWAGAGMRLPRRLLGPRTLRLAVERALGRPGLSSRASAIARWSAEHDGAVAAAQELEAWALQRSPSRGGDSPDASSA